MQLIGLNNSKKNSNLNTVNPIVVEFHSQYFDAKDKQQYSDKEQLLISKMKAMQVGISIWF